MLFKCYFGLGGGFGGARDYEILDCYDEEEAENEAYNLACDEYERYVGLYGLRTTDEIMREDNVSEDEANEIYEEERSSWLEYRVEEYKEDET